jgi:hypothetical protein
MRKERRTLLDDLREIARSTVAEHRKKEGS